MTRNALGQHANSEHELVRRGVGARREGPRASQGRWVVLSAGGEEVEGERQLFQGGKFQGGKFQGKTSRAGQTQRVRAQLNGRQSGRGGGGGAWRNNPHFLPYQPHPYSDLPFAPCVPLPDACRRRGARAQAAAGRGAAAEKAPRTRARALCAHGRGRGGRAAAAGVEAWASCGQGGVRHWMDRRSGWR
eukprot:186528-Chlamydomonas_euryale.AAC.1